MRTMPITSIFATCLLVATMQTPALAQADFYKGKTVTVVVGARAVGSLSVSAQILTRHWGNTFPAIRPSSFGRCRAARTSTPPTTSSTSPTPTA